MILEQTRIGLGCARWPVVCLVLAGVFYSCDQSRAALPAPNVIVFMADDLGAGDIGTYDNLDGLGETSKVPTPTIDALASQGMKFSQARSSASLCAPTRYQVLTGNHTWRGRTENAAWNMGQTSNMLAGQQTVGNVMQSAGYRTGFIGKWHLAGRWYEKNSDNFINPDETNFDQVDFARPFKDGALEHGFDYSALLGGGIQHKPYAFLENDVPVQMDVLGNSTPVTSVSQVQNWAVGTFNNGDTEIIKAGWGTIDFNTRNVQRTFTQKSLDFIHDGVNNQPDQPFFLYHMSASKHKPYVPPSQFEVDISGDGDYDDLNESLAVDGLIGTGEGSDSMQMVNVADAELKALMTKLETTDDPRNPGHMLIDNTVIIFTSDNGGTGRNHTEGQANWNAYGHDSVGGLRGNKNTEFEGGFRVPFIVRWDGQVQAGAVSDQLIATHDVMATLASLTGQGLDVDQAMDSFDMMPALLGHEDDSNPVRSFLMTQQIATGAIPNLKNAYYEDNWKLIVDRNDIVSPLSLGFYDLAIDPTEANDLTNSVDPIIQQLLQDMLSRYVVQRNSARSSPLITSLAADFNLDGVVDGADLLNWQEGYGTMQDAYFMWGDADRDGDVDGSDYLTWQRSITAETIAASSIAVPEPSTVVLLLFSMTALLFRRPAVVT